MEGREELLHASGEAFDSDDRAQAYPVGDFRGKRRKRCDTPDWASCAKSAAALYFASSPRCRLTPNSVEESDLSHSGLPPRSIRRPLHFRKEGRDESRPGRQECLRPRPEHTTSTALVISSTDSESPAHTTRYSDFDGFGGKCAKSFSAALSKFLMFLSDLSESVSLAEPRQIRCFVLASKTSTTRVPTL